MGQKINPIGLRLGITRSWDSKWFTNKGYADLLHEDLAIRNFVKTQLYHAGVSRVEIERAADKVRIFIWTAKPGIIIGKKGQAVEEIKKTIQKMTGKQIFIKIREIKNAELEAQLVAENVAMQLERRISFRRAMKKAVSSALKFKAKGIRIACAGRLGGAEMARREQYLEGRVPLHTLRADIDYGFAEAKTTYGIIGVKVWIFKGEVLPDSVQESLQADTISTQPKKREPKSGKKPRKRRTVQEIDR